ncbi:hypothetical protein SODALDRAFT_326156 [Sodiomyces alkalinus F11]|uniref:Uncharacterized protein n=1 Tax=Sodiomyces alkalinus (strain CBS 110278 / VKM F-3762 / F11) TaxID=1314773 RepID=A0A3N2Q5D7_SODAK|nr:hypothetical protein SODALDRAFT_326156 [Sodiomyces alkalinus F11]ROT41989.1 hypothetical protein SODALDRAFT_326156 [Sodiomyces alkalinus F11]
MVRRTSLIRGTTPRRRRQSTPAQTCSGNGVASSSSSTSASPPTATSLSGEIRLLPLRQVLDGRIQRRIRRNGLSEEMNAIAQEKRLRARETQAELDRLRAQLREKDAEIYQLQNATVVIDTDRIWELEKQLEALRDQLDTRTVENESRVYNWTMAARDPFADDFMDIDLPEDDDDGDGDNDDDQRFGDDTVAQLACSTPSRRARASFPTPPLTSPAVETRHRHRDVPTTPASTVGGRQVLPPTTPTCHAAVQTSFIMDPEKQDLEEQVESLRLEMSKLSNTLDSYTSLAGRLSERMATIAPCTPRDVGNSHSTATSPPQAQAHAELESQLESLLRSISDRSAALHALTTSVTALGFPGQDAGEVISSIATGFRTARLELEYLTPGEIALPLTSNGAAVLDLLLTRLRALAAQAREDEADIDEYHAIEQSLRRQLGARVEAMDALSADLARARDLLAQKDGRIRELEVAVDRLKGATGSYAHDVAELEALVGRMEGEHGEVLARRDEDVAERERRIEALSGKVAALVGETEGLRVMIAEVEAARDESGRRAGDALAARDARDARVAELKGQVERLNEALRRADEMVKDLRVEKGALQGRLAEERERGWRAVEAVREELERVVSMSREVLATPTKKSATRGGEEQTAMEKDQRDAVVASRRGSLLAGDLARKGRGSKRYDSGVGLVEGDATDI